MYNMIMLGARRDERHCAWRNERH